MMRSGVRLAPYTTFGLGGPARSFVTVNSMQDLQWALNDAGQQTIYLLGSGSNLLVSDDGVDGLVIENRMGDISFIEKGTGVLVSAGAGVDWDELVTRAAEKGLQGIECLSGIPGRVGAAPVQNIGAYGQSISDVLDSVRGIDLDSSEHFELSGRECGFGYRQSIFQKKNLMVTEVSLLLHPDRGPLLKYQDLSAQFEGSSPSLQEVRQAVLEIRGSKGALAMDEWPKLRSAGSFFKNPIIPQEIFKIFREELEDPGSARKWFWPRDDGTVKVAAGRLIEGAGFKRGFRDGTVGNSPHHSLSLVAYDGATSADVVALAWRIQEAIFERFDVLLDVEPQLWGWDVYPLLRSAT